MGGGRDRERGVEEQIEREFGGERVRERCGGIDRERCVEEGVDGERVREMLMEKG